MGGGGGGRGRGGGGGGGGEGGMERMRGRVGEGGEVVGGRRGRK